MQPGQEILRKWDARAARLHPRTEVTGDGLVLGAGTVVVNIEKGKEGAPRLSPHNEQRILALLATAYERPVGTHVLARIERACELWNEGEKALATIHLAHARLPVCGEDEALRLFVAEELLEDDVPPVTLLEAHGFDPATMDLFKYPGQPRVPAGNGHESGEWTDGQASFTPVSFRGPKERHGRGGRRGALDAIRSFLDWLRERQKRKESESAPETTASTQDQRAEPQIKPFGTPQSDLPRPGYGEKVSIPGLPDDIKGTDVTEPGARMANYKLDMSRSEFENELSELGWTKEPSKDGNAMNYK